MQEEKEHQLKISVSSRTVVERSRDHVEWAELVWGAKKMRGKERKKKTKVAETVQKRLINLLAVAKSPYLLGEEFLSFKDN